MESLLARVGLHVEGPNILNVIYTIEWLKPRPTAAAMVAASAAADSDDDTHHEIQAQSSSASRHSAIKRKAKGTTWTRDTTWITKTDRPGSSQSCAPSSCRAGCGPSRLAADEQRVRDQLRAMRSGPLLVSGALDVDQPT